MKSVSWHFSELLTRFNWHGDLEKLRNLLSKNFEIKNRKGKKFWRVYRKIAKLIEDLDRFDFAEFIRLVVFFDGNGRCDDSY